MTTFVFDSIFVTLPVGFLCSEPPVSYADTLIIAGYLKNGMMCFRISCTVFIKFLTKYDYHPKNKKAESLTGKLSFSHSQVYGKINWERGEP
jgi:hypothetical protein